MIFKSGEETQRLKWLFSSCKNGAWGTEAEGETDIVCIRAADFDGRLGRLRGGERTLRSVDPETYEKLALRRGDIILEKSGGGEKQLVGRAAIYDGDEPSITSNFLARCRPAPGMEPAYVNYLLLAIYNGRGTFPHLKQSTGIQNLDLASFLDIRVRVPSLDIQQRVARFLDEKTARIDGLIEKKRALLDRLAEKRLALITRAVTKGLNPDAPMKPSGIDWLGSIPAHWEVRRIKELGKLIGGTGFPHEFQGQKDLELPFFKVVDLGRVSQSQKMLEAENSIDRATAELLGASVIEPGDVAFAKVGAALLLNRFRNIGVCCCIDNNMMAFRSGRKISPDFALLAFNMIDFSNIVNPGAVPSVSGSQVGQIEIALPHLEEQIEIVESLGQKFEKIESAEEQVTNSQWLIEEYRGALITSAVTGQLKEM